MRQFVFDSWNSVMDHNMNPLRHIPDVHVRHMIMQVLAFMWAAVFAFTTSDVIMNFAISSIAHTVIIAAIVITVATFKVAKSNPEILCSHKIHGPSNNFRFSITISKKVAKKAVDRNKLRRFFQEWISKTIKTKNYHKPYWLLVNLKIGISSNDKVKLIEEFQNLMLKSGLI